MFSAVQPTLSSPQQEVEFEKNRLHDDFPGRENSPTLLETTIPDVHRDRVLHSLHTYRWASALGRHLYALGPPRVQNYLFYFYKKCLNFYIRACAALKSDIPKGLFPHSLLPSKFKEEFDDDDDEDSPGDNQENIVVVVAAAAAENMDVLRAVSELRLLEIEVGRREQNLEEEDKLEEPREVEGEVEMDIITDPYHHPRSQSDDDLLPAAKDVEKPNVGLDVPETMNWGVEPPMVEDCSAATILPFTVGFSPPPLPTASTDGTAGDSVEQLGAAAYTISQKSSSPLENISSACLDPDYLASSPMGSPSPPAAQHVPSSPLVGETENSPSMSTLQPQINQKKKKKKIHPLSIDGWEVELMHCCWYVHGFQSCYRSRHLSRLPKVDPKGSFVSSEELQSYFLECVLHEMFAIVQKLDFEGMFKTVPPRTFTLLHSELDQQQYPTLTLGRDISDHELQSETDRDRRIRLPEEKTLCQLRKHAMVLAWPEGKYSIPTTPFDSILS
jgi:hypothetical protein